MSFYAHNQPQKGEAVWVEGRKPQPNGYILRIDYEEQEVAVVFHDNGGILYYAIERMLGNKVGNKWMMYADPVLEPEMEEESRLDVMRLFDLELEKQQPSIPRLMFLSKYFDYRHEDYGHGCVRRRSKLASLIGQAHTIDWSECSRLDSIHSIGSSISNRIRKSSTGL